jgi:hypothetical protein
LDRIKLEWQGAIISLFSVGNDQLFSQLCDDDVFCGISSFFPNTCKIPYDYHRGFL